MSLSFPMTSQGILDAASTLHTTSTRMDREVSASRPSQSFLGSWTDFLNRSPYEDASPPRGLLSLVAEVRSPLHVIGPTADYQRLSRFNVRMQQLWDMGQKQGLTWNEPRPSDWEPGKSTSPGSSLESAAEIALVVALLWLLSRR